MQQTDIPRPLLEAVEAGQAYFSTRQFAGAISKAPQTLRKLYSLNGHAYGVRPAKFGRDLRWPVTPVLELIKSGRQTEAA